MTVQTAPIPVHTGYAVRLGKQYHAHCQTEQKASSPQPPCSASDFLHLSQTKRKSGFKKTGDNQDNPSS